MTETVPRVFHIVTATDAHHRSRLGPGVRELGVRHDDFNNMHGWFQRILKSRVFSSEQNEHEEKRTENPASFSLSPPSSLTPCPTSSSSPPGAAPSLNSLLRWSRKYDVFVCHSSVGSDCEEACKLVSFLEALPRGLRCFLQHRDDCPGGATSTELCQAVQDSHLWALLITPDFLQDDWCQYMMHQALAEGPMSNRIIPLYQNLSRAHYPKELRFFCCINLSQSPEKGYARINMTVVTYLTELAKNTKTLNCNTENSGDDASLEENSSKEELKT